MACGAYFGMLIQARYFKNSHWRGMLETTWTKSGLRLLISILLLAPFASIYLYVPSTASIGIMMIFKTAVPFFLMFILLFAGFDVVSVKAKLVNDENSGTLPIDKVDKYL